MAGDRRSTMGNIIAQRDVEKVFPADEYSCIGIAGVAGVAVELVRLFQLELEHYEKIEGMVLSLDGKANRLSHMIRGNLAMAMQGLAVLPLFAGFDLELGRGRIFSYDVTGGRSEEHTYYSVGSGSLFARGAEEAVPRRSQPGRCRHGLHRVALRRGRRRLRHRGLTCPEIFPMVALVDVRGYRRLAEDDVAEIVESVVAARQERPDGPQPR